MNAIAHEPVPFTALGGPLQLVQVRGDAMWPTLRGEWDFVMIAPVSRFLYDDLYVVRDEVCGALVVYRAASATKGQLALIVDNPAYGATPDERSHLVPAESFNRAVVGIVVASLKVHSQDIVRRAFEGSWQ